MVMNVVKYAVVGYAVVKSTQYVYRKIQDWRGKDEQ